MDFTNIEKYDIVMRENDYAIFYEGKILKTENHNEFASKNIRLLQLILNDIILLSEINSISSFNIFQCEKDSINDLDFITPIGLKEDFLLLQNFPRKESSESDELIFQLEDNLQLINLIFGGLYSINNVLKKFLVENGLELDVNTEIDHTSKLYNFIRELYFSLPDYKKAIIYLLEKKYSIGYILPILLVLKKITLSEYSYTLLSYLIQKNLEKSDKQKFISSILELNRSIFFEASKCIDYISFYEQEDNKISEITDIIKLGENDNLEFKSSLRWNIKESKKDAAIEHAVLKTINAFLNSRGGTLFIGVEDNGNIGGIEIDKFENDDRFLIHFWNILKASMGEETVPFVQTKLERINDKSICMVKVLRSPIPVFLNQKGFDEEFYIRIGPTSTKLGVKDTYNYISNHFEKA